MSATQDYVALDWIKGEITLTLERAQHALETVAATPADTSSMLSCLTSIHQAHSTLKMVELEGPIQVAAEMEQLAQGLVDGEIPDELRAQEILMQTILQMPSYLDRIQTEQRDSSDFVISVVNNLRVARGEAKTDKTNVAKHTEPARQLEVKPAAEITTRFEKQKSHQTARKIRHRYQQALVALLKKQQPRENLKLMGKAFSMLVKMCGVSAKGNLFRLSLAVVEGVSVGAIKMDASTADKFKRIDAELKDLATRGTKSLGEVSAELGNELLALVNGANAETPRIAAVKSLFSVQHIANPETEDINFGPDNETLSTVSKIIVEELRSITDKLDLFVRSSSQDAAELYQLIPSLEQIASTLTVIDMTDEQTVLLGQVEIIKQLESDAQGPSENQLLEMAKAFLEVGSALAQVMGEDEERGRRDNFGDLNEAMASVIRETRNTLGLSKDQVIGFVSSEFDLSKILSVPENLRSLAGGLSVISQQRSGDILKAAAAFIERELIEKQSRPELSQMDDLADAITSVDYFLERLLESAKEPYLQMLEVAEAAAVRLGYAVDSAVQIDAEAGSAQNRKKALAELPAEGSLEVIAEGSLEVIAEGSHLETETRGESDSVDDEILSVFIEEADEILNGINEYLLRWRNSSPEEESLIGIRRLFHTLKGSARIVGAIELGELSGSIENMLTRVIDKIVAANSDLSGFLAVVANSVSEGIEALRQGRHETYQVDELIAKAQAMATGQTGIATDSVSLFEKHEDSHSAPIERKREVDLEWDPALDEIFVAEASEKVAIIKAFAVGEGALTPDVIEAFHTLKGSAGVAGVTSIARLAAPMEKWSSDLFMISANVSTEYFWYVNKTVELLEECLLNLNELRFEMHGVDELLFRLSEIAELDMPDALSSFDFEEIQVLNKPQEIIEGWSASQLSEVVLELENVRAQASRLKQVFVEEMATALLVAHENLSSRPNDETRSLLLDAHEQLILMLDCIAASQQVSPAPEVVQALYAIDFAALERGQESEDIVAEPSMENTESSANPGMVNLPADDIDLDVLALFLEEAEDLIEGIDQSILEWSENTTEISHLDNILRLLHTMKGGARIAGLNSLGEYAHNFETDLMSLRTQRKTFDEHFFVRVNDRQDEITRRIGIYARYAEGTATEQEMSAMQQAKILVGLDSTWSETSIPDMVVVSDNADSGAASSQETTAGRLSADDIDFEILPIFIEEALALLESIDQSILDWSGATNDHTYLNNLLRYLHTLKGGARLAGLNSLGDNAHYLETFLTGVQQNPVELDDDFFASLNRHQDEITRQIAIYRRASEGSAETDETVSVNHSASPAQSQDVSTTDPSPASNVEAAERPLVPSQEMVRVSADLLDELVSLAGETSITRGRVEQQITDFGESLEEMEETIVRIREQVRRLEIEAESRETVFRSHSKDADAGFDELELDRYTMLQEISRSLSEGSSDMMDLKDTLLDKSRDAETLLHQQARLSSELQEGLTRTRMVSFARLIPRLRRNVRQISVEVGKSVKFDAFNIEGELDRSVLERIVAPLEHMLRNAIDHGIESRKDRIAANKPETGKISLRLSREGGYVVMTVSDDGAGIDVGAVKRKAVERGLINSVEQVTDQEAMQFIVGAGFSTAEKLTQISGRGVGMDVVNSEIKQLGGSLHIDSKLGVGTEFSIRIPFTVSINRALMVVVKEETYAVPLNTIEGIVRVSPYELEAYYQPDAPMFEYAGQPYRLTYMGRLLARSDNPSLEGQMSPLPVILARSGELSIALQVDKVIGSREVVVKALGRQFDKVAGISGATVLGDGSVVVILDVLALVRNADALTEQYASDDPLPSETGTKTVMIVDDSVTVRKVTSRLMERRGWKVTTAKDGLEAVEQLQNVHPDIVLLDIEMPKMDGFEVLRSVRRDERLKNLPIIMITSRSGEKHQQQALELGVNAYLGKPFQEAGLMSTIEEVLVQVKKQDSE